MNLIDLTNSRNLSILNLFLLCEKNNPAKITYPIAITGSKYFSIQGFLSRGKF